ncbi:MAG: ABC transporter substrate-binding protein [Polyangiaceae bacterium]
MRLLLALLLVGLTACAPREEDGEAVLRLGFFARLTHAPALTGIESGRFQSALGETRLEPRAFEYGNAAVEAMFAGELDAAYLGPNPAINAFVRSKGDVRILTEAARGGSALVVRADRNIDSARDLAGKKIATPQIASTQDIALRRYLRSQQLRTSSEGGDVTVLPLSTPFILSLFAQGELDGAWVSEPLVAQLLAQGNAKTLVEEADTWPQGQYPATVVAVRTSYLRAHPDAVKRLLAAHRAEVRLSREQPGEALSTALTAMRVRAGRQVPPEVAAAAWKHLSVSDTLTPRALERLADDARGAGFLPQGSLDGLVVSP